MRLPRDLSGDELSGFCSALAIGLFVKPEAMFGWYALSRIMSTA
jgi:hypothetical protein